MNQTVVEKPVQKRTQSQGLVKKVGVFELIRRNVLLVALIVMILLFEFLTGSFLTTANLRSVALDIAVLLIVAVPAALLLISGYVDFSVGCSVGLSAVVAGLLMANGGLNPFAAIILTLLTGLGVGLLNGLLVAYGRLSPIIVTMGMLSVLSGLSLGIGQKPTVGYPEA